MAHRALAIFCRRLFTSLTILSLLLCLATVVLWIESYWRGQALYRLSGSTPAFGAGSCFGELSLFDSRESTTSRWQYSVGPSSAAFRYRSMRNLGRLPGSADFLGFGYIFTARLPFRVIFFPHWFLALILAVLPALRLRAIRRTRRLNRVGLCERCGYDLRATPARCPECGHQPNAHPVA